MSDRFTWDPLAIRDALRGLGYDADLSDAWSGGTIRARRERGDRACVLVLDAAGRLRAEVTALLDETGRAGAAGGVPIRMVTTTERTVIVTGTMPTLASVAAVVAALDDLADPELPPPAPAVPDWPPPP